MNKQKKIEYQEQLEAYLERHRIYDLFESIMKGLLKERPADALEFMASRLERPERTRRLNLARRVFVMGPTGSRKKEKALTLAEEFNYVTVSVGDLLGREISKKSELGKRIKEAQTNFAYGSVQ